MSPEAKARLDWHDQEVMLRDCLAILQFLSKSDRQAHYAFAQLRDAAGAKDPAILARALLYLCSASNPVLRMVFLLADGDHASELEPEDFEIQGDGSFIDLSSGLEINKSDIYVVYDLIADKASLFGVGA